MMPFRILSFATIWAVKDTPRQGMKLSWFKRPAISSFSNPSPVQ